jgi:hypothetical protein
MTGNETALLTQVLGKFESASETFLQSSALGGQVPSVTSDEHSEVHETAQEKVAERPSADTGISCDLNEKRGTEEKLESSAAAENHDDFRNRRRHGSAWPH